MQLVRIYFSKQDEAAYISHLDLQRVMARALRRSGLPVWYSQGFNPHIYCNFSLPLPLFHHSTCESVDCKTEAENVDFSTYIDPLNAALPRGIRVQAIAPPVHASSAIGSAEYSIRYPNVDALKAAVDAYNAAEAAPVVRKTKRSEQTVDLKEMLPRLKVSGEGDTLCVRLPAGGALNYSPELLCGYLRENCDLAAMPHILRKAIFTADGEEYR